MNGPVARVLLIGVPAPPPIRSTNERKLAYGKTAVGFPELDTVPEELEWFDDLLTARLGERNMSLTRVVSPANTTSEKVRKAITEAVSLEPVPPLLILYLAGHGVQFERPADDDGAAISLNGSRRFDEAFATSDGYVLDRELKRMLDAKPATTRLIAFVDTCHADGMLGVRGVQALDIVEDIANALPDLDLRVAEPFISALPARLADLPNVRLQRAAEAIDDADIVVLLVDHDHFRSLNRSRLDGKVVYDTRGVWR